MLMPSTTCHPTTSDSSPPTQSISSHKYCAVIGRTHFCIACCERLITRDWHILAIISDDPTVVQWGQAHNVTVSSTQTIDDSMVEHADYLFSIINDWIIPATIVDAVKLAVNYHDAPLPRYAGVNATTWAILNGETHHGITWHQIDTDIDTGHILCRATFPINDDDTSCSLNLKCTEYGLQTFEQLLQQLVSDSWSSVPQDCTERTYYARDQLPVSYGVINTLDKAVDIDQLCRALYFGKYPNRLTALKILIHNRCYIVDACTVDITDEHTTSTWIVKQANKDEWVIGLTGGQIRIHALRTLQNAPITLASFSLEVGESLYPHHWQPPTLPKYDERRIVHALQHYQYPLSASEAVELSQHYTISRVLHAVEDQHFYIALTSAFLARTLTQHDTLSVDLLSQPSSHSGRNSLVNYSVPINIDRKALENTTLDTWCADILHRSQANLFHQDLLYRYRLAPRTLKCAIAISTANVDVTLIKSYGMVFGFDEQRHPVIVNHHPSQHVLIQSFIAWFNDRWDEYRKARHLRVNDLIVLTKTDYHKLCHTIYPTTDQHHAQRTIRHYFESQVDNAPDHVALTWEGQHITYTELNQRANRLAHYICHQYQQHNKQSIPPDILIALYFDRSVEMIVSILAVLKVGAGYVPIDPTYPEERWQYILNDTHSALLLTPTHYLSRFISSPECDTATLPLVIALDDTLYASMPTDNPNMASHHVAYVMYTSGTTGRPKGVIQTQQNLVSVIETLLTQWPILSNDTWVLSHTYVFDVSIWEIFGALCSGGRLVISTAAQTQHMQAFYTLCYKEKLTICTQTATAFNVFIDVALANVKQNRLSHLRYLFFGGEVLDASKLQAWYRAYPNKPTLINMYGTTETTFTTLTQTMRPHFTATDCIGRPLADQVVHILDDNLRPLPAGAVGELCISGRLAQGYINQPTLTQQRFIDNPFQTNTHNLSSGGKLYKTGDWVRMLADGCFQFIGRRDHQVKLRGYRIELHDIAKQLMAHTHINQAVVSMHGDNTTSQLIAYYVAEQVIPRDTLYHYLADKLPAYMVPHVFVHLTQLPLTINGKLDDQQLPRPELADTTLPYVAPSSEKETIICQAFAKVLHMDIDHVGVDADFFRMGGHSLNAINLTFILREHLAIQVNDIFVLKTPRRLAAKLNWATTTISERLHSILQSIPQKPDNQQASISSPSMLRSDLANDTSTTSLNTLLEQDSSLYPSKPITAVLLTGATGFFGCNVLHQLLTSTRYRIVLLVRGATLSAAKHRLSERFADYFGQSLSNFDHRIDLFLAELTQPNLALSSPDYQYLVDNVDSIIHAAGLVKHYGEHHAFYAANVQSTIHLLTLAKKTHLKDFHYISSCSAMLPDNTGRTRTYDEDYLPSTEDIDRQTNIYHKTKLQGEHVTVAYRQKGVNTHIYRLGNLAFMAHNGKTPCNLEDNAFAYWLRLFLKIGCIAEPFTKMEVSPADDAACAVVTLFDKHGMANKQQVWHIVNPHVVDITSWLNDSKKSLFNLHCVDIGHFIHRLLHCIQRGLFHHLIARFFIRHGGLDDESLIDKNITVSQTKTEHVLNKLGFYWRAVSRQRFARYLTYIDETPNLIESTTK